METYDVMVDLETTGIDPEHTAMIQLAAVKFNLDTREVDAGDMFCQSLLIPKNRFWDEGTRAWWAKQDQNILSSIYATMRDPRTVLQEFGQWCGYDNPQPLRLWAKPTSFEWPFLQSYFKQFEVTNPFSFRDAICLNSFFRGLRRQSKLVKTTTQEPEGTHHALTDVIYQIEMLFDAMEGKFEDQASG